MELEYVEHRHLEVSAPWMSQRLLELLQHINSPRTRSTKNGELPCLKVVI